MKYGCLPICLFLSFLSQLATGQSKFDEATFRSMSSSERQELIYSLEMDAIDTVSFLQVYPSMLSIAEADGDEATTLMLHYEKYHNANFLRPLVVKNVEPEIKLLEEANKNGLAVEALVAEHFLLFQQFNNGLIPHAQMYAGVLRVYEKMEALGFEKLRYYDTAQLLFWFGRFMFQTEDYEQAMRMLKMAEKYAETSDRGLQGWMYIMNYIQSIYQRQKNYGLGIQYAKQIIEVTKDCPSQKPNIVLFCKTWLGIASVDIASMYIGQGKYEEGERYANEGYALLKVPLDAHKQALRAEYDMLQVLIPIKLELRKLDEAGALLQRASDIAPILDQQEQPDYFKHVKFYQNYARYYELKGDYAAAMRYTNFAKPLQDSLDRRNDAHTLEKIQQRITAEKYTEQLKLMERESELQKLLRNAALVIILLIIALALGNYKRLRYKRQQSLKELEMARSELEGFTNSLREKSELAENLRGEIERLSQSGERSEYLEKLTKSTILTDEDWTQFRSIFEKVHPNFIAEQKTQYPDLTQAELRYLVLEKLQLTTHEMANMLGVSDGTIRQTRMRMKRKTGINNGEL